jgi:hypothetical protein
MTILYGTDYGPQNTPGNGVATAMPRSTGANANGEQGTWKTNAAGINEFVPAPAPTSPTIGALYGAVPAEDKALDSATSAYGAAASTPVDEAAIRAEVMKRLQTEIDATNQVYGEKLRQAKIGGEGRLGSNAAISARRGLLGSDFGQAANDKVVSDNNSVYSGIDEEKAAAIAALTDKGNAAAQSEIAAKNSVKQQSATDYISFLSKQGERKTTRTNTAASALLSSGVDLSTLTPADIAGIASSYNVAPAELQAAIVSTKASLAKAAKDNLVTAPITSSIYEPDGKGGYKTVQQGTATPDAALKEYQYAVANDAYTGSLADWNAQKANQKVTERVTRDPLTGEATFYQGSGPAVAGTGKTAAPGALPAAPKTTSPVSLPSSSPKLSGDPNQLTPLPQPKTYAQKAYLKDFSTGKTATQVGALNTAVGHLFDANSIFSTINSGQIPGFNSVGAYVKSATGQAAIKNYQQAQTLVSDEIAGAYGADAASDRAKQQALGSAVDSPEQHKGYVQTAASLMASKIASNVQSYRTAMGKNPDSLDIFISPANQVKLKAMGIEPSTLAPGLSPSPYATALLTNAHVLKDGSVYIPVDPSNPKGSYQKLQ